MKTKITALILAVTLLFTLTACGNSSGSNSAQGDTSSNTPEAADDNSKIATVTICGTNGPGDTQSNAHEELARVLNSYGDWNATAMVSGEMGATDDVLEQAMVGAGVIAATDPARLASYVPEIGILMMPYMFDNYDQLDNLLNTDMYKEWQDKLEKQGLVLLTNNCITGFRNFVTKKEVTKPADLQGQKIRTMGSAIAVNSVNAMGAVATAMAQSDAYNGIETGVVDGGEWQIPTIYSLRMYEVCSHMSLTRHFLLTGSIVCGSAWFNTLTERQQNELREAAVEVYGKTKEAVMEDEVQFTAEMQEKGLIVDEPDLDAFRKATEYLYSDSNTTGGVDFLALRDELYTQMGISQ